MSVGFLLLLSKVWGFLKAVPWRAWVVAAVILLWLVDRSHQYNQGVAFERDRWEAAQAAADAAAAAVAIQRAEKAQDIATEAAMSAATAVTETRTRTAVAVERANHAMRSAPPASAGCPDYAALPDVVRIEGREAVERARAAGRPLRTRHDP